MEATTSSTVQPQNMYDYINSIFMNPVIFVIFIVIFILYFIFFSNLGNSVSKESTGSSGLEDLISGSMKADSGSDSGSASNAVMRGSNTMMFIVIFLFIVLLVINGVQYYLGIDIVTTIQNLFKSDSEAKVDIKLVQTPTESSDTPQTVSTPISREEVFNIPGNYYNYDDARTLCQAYGTRLAKYEEVESAYNSGAEWCNYGWSEGQMALFPTQKSTYDGLQKIKGHENDCGRPGINGGYMANPKIQYGVNCYGIKPKMTKEEEELMQTTTPYPKTEKDLEMERRVNFWKTKLDEILVSPFNYKNWNKV